MLARRLPIRRLVVGRYAPAVVCSGSFLPHEFCGGQKWPVCFRWKRLRRVCCLSPSAPGGGTGEKGKKGIAGFGVLLLVARKPPALACIHGDTVADPRSPRAKKEECVNSGIPELHLYLCHPVKECRYS